MPLPILDPGRRHDFVLLFDVTNGNPNGDPDAGNLPRFDPQTMHGLVTDVCLKRKVRDYVHVFCDQPIFIQNDKALNTKIQEAAAADSEKGREEIPEPSRKQKTPDLELQGRLAEDYYDNRMFGAVLSTGERFNAGQLRGPVQINFAQSLHPILPQEFAITRQARTTETRQETGGTEMGRKALVHYGLYRGHGFFSPKLADQTGVSNEDLRMFWEALIHMFEHDRSAARGEMIMHQVYVFSHTSKRGNAPAHKLFKLVKIETEEEHPRSFDHFSVSTKEEIENGLKQQGYAEKVALTVLPDDWKNAEQ